MSVKSADAALEDGTDSEVRRLDGFKYRKYFRKSLYFETWQDRLECSEKATGTYRHRTQQGGEEMALEKGRERQFSFDICFSSPLKRAVRTAELYLTGSQTPILTDDRLCEMSFGQYEGMTVDDNFDKLPISVFFSDPLSYRADRGAESVEELFQEPELLSMRKFFQDSKLLRIS